MAEPGFTENLFSPQNWENGAKMGQSIFSFFENF